MLRLRYARQTRVFLSPPSAATATFFSTGDYLPCTTSFLYPLSPSSNITPSNGSTPEIHRSDLVYYFREWFLSRKNPLFDRIFEILRSQEGSSAKSALSELNLRLTESLVLDVLNYEKKDVLSCLKFFDWAGREPGFHHTRATFNAIFQMISKSKLTNLMEDLLQTYMKRSYDKVMYYDTLVVGYAVAGKSETALHLFGKMRFQGLDLDAVAYHVLLNSLVEEGYFDVVECLVKEIRIRGFQNQITHSIMIKSFCHQNELERGEEYLRGLMEGNGAEQNGVALASFVAALCKNKQYERASFLIDEFQKMGLGLMEQAYDVWIRELVNAGRLDNALEFLKDKRGVDAYIPDVFRYNTLICRLLKENRLEEVSDLLVDMKEMGIFPDDATMNAVLCFLCKVGLIDIAMDLYDSSAEFGLSVNYMAYNYLINALVGDVSAKEAYRLLKKFVEQGYLPGEKTFAVIADALCREGRLDEMKELVLFILDHNIVPNSFICDKFISALCSIGRVEEGYLLYDLLNRVNRVCRRDAYKSLIGGFSKSNRGDIAARLLIEMQESGFSPSRKLYREVICCLCKSDNAEKQFMALLEMQLAQNLLPASFHYEFFICGAGHAGKPDLAMQAYEIMRRSGLEPSLKLDMLLLQSYLKNKKVAHALQLFRDFSTKGRASKLWHIMIVGLCRVGEANYASQILENMKTNRLTPSIECYEELIKLYCDLGQYHKAVDIFNDMTRIGRPVSSFIGNVFLLHALRTRKLYDAWVSSSLKRNLTPASWMLGHLVGIFCGCVEGDYNDKYVESLIQKCFRINTYTNNMLLRRLSIKGVDFACDFFNRLREKGYEPNRWSYDIIVHGLAKDGRLAEARIWMEEMLRKGYGPTEETQRLI